jgi:peptide/nickel transport system substrate-binding protein
MPPSRFTLLPITLVLALALAVVLAACSPQPQPTPEATLPVIRPTLFDTPAPTITPAPPASIFVRLDGVIDTLHPFLATSDAARIVLGALFVGCAGEDADRQVIALGCERVPTAENGDARFIGEGLDRQLEVTFRIRPGWRWTDGRPVTAQDAVYAWQLAMSPEFGLRDRLAQSVFSMKAVDERTVRVVFLSAAQAQAAAAGTLRGEVPFEYFSQLGDYSDYSERQTPLAPATYWAAPRWLPSHLLQDVPAADQRASVFGQRPIGDGPFELAEVTSTRVELKPSAQPFPLGDSVPGGLVFVLDGQLPEGTPAVTFDAALAGSATMDAQTFPASVEQLVLNVDRFPFDDVRVRRAIAHALERDVLGQDPAETTAVPFSLVHDRAHAGALLSEAGWQCDVRPCVKGIANENGEIITRTLAFKITTTEREPRNIVAQAIQRQLAELGFAVDVEIVFGLGKDSRMFAPYEQGGILLRRDFDAALYQIDAPAAAAQFACSRIPTAEIHDAGQGNASGYCDPELDALLARSEDSEDTIGPRRADASAQARTRIEQAVPGVPLYYVRRPVFSRRVSGLKPAAHLPITWNAWEWRVER